jgi:hypothetical protein
MNIIDLRKSLRRSLTTQRKEDRRKVPYEFGSPEWLDYIKNNHMDCPKFNRRQADRRTEKRRLPDRRQQHDAEPNRSEKKYARIFLTPAEKKLIEDLYLNDLE